MKSPERLASRRPGLAAVVCAAIAAVMATRSVAEEGVPRRGETVAATKCTGGSETTPPLCPATTGIPKSVEVSGSSCKRFVPTPYAVRRWLRTARRIPDFIAADATIDMPPCVASGTVTFMDGRSGTWNLRQNGYGVLQDDSGTTILYVAGPAGWPFIH